MNRKFKRLYAKLKSPFNNRKGLGFPQLILASIASVLVVTFISWILMLVLQYTVERTARTVCYNIVDGIAESGTLTTSMQTEFYKGFNNTKFYVGDYVVKYYKYDYTGGTFNKVLLGTSDNGSLVPEFTVPSGTAVQVVFSSKENVPLDNILKVLSPSSTNGAGLKTEAGGKVY